VASSSQNGAPLHRRVRTIRRALTIPIVSVLIVLPSAGLASPPDPTWINGIYDGADFDDVVSLVTDTPVSSGEASYQLVIPRSSSVGVLTWRVSSRVGSFRLQPLRGPPRVFVSSCHWSRQCSRSPRSPSSLVHESVTTPPDRSGESGDTPRRRVDPRSLCSDFSSPILLGPVQRQFLSSDILILNEDHRLMFRGTTYEKRAAGGLVGAGLLLFQLFPAGDGATCTSMPRGGVYVTAEKRSCTRGANGDGAAGGN
jgi:hypothetical protein